MTRYFIQLIAQNLTILGLIFNFLGTIFLSFGLLKSNKQIEKESGSYWDSNSHLKQSLLSNRRLAIIGLSFLTIGFLLQIFAYSKIIIFAIAVFKFDILIEIFNSPLVIALLSIFLTSLLGPMVYRRQKERDEIHKKYIEGLENLGKNISNGVGAILTNFATASNGLKYFRQLDSSFESYKNLAKNLKEKIIMLNNILIGYDIFYVEKIFPKKSNKLIACYMSSIAEIKIINMFFENEFIDTINEFIKKEKDYSNEIKDRIFDGLVKKSIQKNERASTFYGLASIIDSIVFRIKKMSISNYKHIPKINQDQEINRIFRSDLEEWAEKTGIDIKNL